MNKYILKILGSVFNILGICLALFFLAKMII